jgi:hypothetical protein
VADNVTLNPGAGGSVAAADEISAGVYAQRIKLIHGVDGVNDGDVAKTNPLPVALYPVAAGGLAQPKHAITTGVNNEKQNVKASAGQLYKIRGFNGEVYPVFLKFHDTAGVPTPGAGVVMTFPVQAGMPITEDFLEGIAFNSGIAMTVTKGLADADTTQVGTNSVFDIYSK